MSKPVYVLQAGSHHEGYTVNSVHDTLSGAQNSPRTGGFSGWCIDEVPINGKPTRTWYWRDAKPGVPGHWELQP